MALNPGHVLLNGQYLILHLLGRGGFGFVYQARDTLLDRDVAIKELIPGLVGDEVMLKRFLVEARATMELTHERIVRTHNVFHEGDNYYIVMECMAGGSLEARLREHGPLPVAEAVQVVAEVCEGLEYAHGRGVVHCDLKPANILFDTQGQAKVADFGIAHVSGEMLTRTWMTPAGFVAGTLPYMSPEQADGVRDDPLVDVYAVGAVLYRMLAGRTYLEFDERETPGATADNVVRIRNESPVPLSAHDRRVPTWLDGVVLKALAKRPEDRYPGARALRAALLPQQTPHLALSPTRLVSRQQAPASAQTSTRRTPPAVGVRATPAPKRKPPLPAWFWPAVFAAVLLLVVLTIAVAALVAGWDEQSVAAPIPKATNTTVPPTNTPAAGEAKLRTKDGMTMLFVPAGAFTMGSNDGGSDERPVHTVTLDAYWIDRTEVTNAQFRTCVEAGVCQVPAICDQGEPAYGDGGKTDHPVVCVDWNQANAYCEWAGARLPTEAEWEKAARGTDGRDYPWGDSAPACSKAQGSGCRGQTVPVGSKTAWASPYGALDMAGNVWEWVKDWYDVDYYSRSPSDNPKGPNSGSSRVLRGGSWGGSWDDVSAAFRNHDPQSTRRSLIGFRCAGSPGE